MTDKELARRLEEIRAILSAEITPFEGDSPAVQAKRKARAKDDFEYFCRTYMPNFFTSPSAQFHYEQDALLERRQGDIVVFCGPREHAKTVRWSIAYILHQIVYRKRRFILLIGETEDMGIDMTLNVREHFGSNSRIRHDFGDLVNYGSWAENEFITKNNVKVLARGYKSTIRGLIFGPYRPDLIRIDDISSIKNARNEILEKEKLGWIMGECYGGMDSHGTLFWTGNVIRKTSAIYQAEIAHRKGQNLLYKRTGCIANGKPIWPERYDLGYFEEIRKKVGSVMFAREYEQNPVEEGKYYQYEWFHTFTPLAAPDLWKVMEKRIMYLDPGYGSKRKTAKKRGSDKKVAVVMGWNSSGYYLFDALSRQVSLESYGSAVCELFAKWRPSVVYYEGNFAQADLIGRFLDEAATKKNMMLPKKPFYNFTAKEDRIERGNPFAENGLLHHVVDNTDVYDIIDNLVMYPDVEFDDPADCFAGGLEILDLYGKKIKIKTFRR